MRVISCTVWSKGEISKLRLKGDGTVYRNGTLHSLASWSMSADEQEISITFSYNPDIAGALHVFKMLDKESHMFNLDNKDGYTIPNKRHTHRSILIVNHP